MKHKHIAKILFFSSLFLTIIIFLFRQDIYSFLESLFKTMGTCESYIGDYSCYNWSWLTLDTFLFLFINFLFLSIFLFFINQESLVKWYKFARIAIPLGFLLVIFLIFTYKPSTGNLGVVPSFDIVPTFFIPIIFSIISLFLFFKNRKNNQQEKREKGYFI